MAASDVVVEGERRFRKSEQLVRATIVTSLRALGVNRRAVRVYLVGNGIMKNDVLSFPHPAGVPRPDHAGRFLGEIYLNPGYIREHGEDLRFMAAHGFLHLLGYDHEGEHDILAMEEKERAIMAALGASGQ